MAAATTLSLSGCSTKTHFFFKSTAPFIRHTIAVGLFNNHRSSVTIPSKGKFAPSTASIGGRRMQLLCYSTETTTTTTVDGGDIREAANTLDIRVGKILKAWRHEEADSLYVEEVDVGEPEPRIICSGLVKYIPLHLLQDRNVIVLANLKPRNMRGVKSFGMLLAASDAAHENVELLVPPVGAVPGERVWFGSLDERENLPQVASPNQRMCADSEEKIWEQVQAELKTDEYCVATLGLLHPMRTSSGLIITHSLNNANIS